jgi:hypothetical protein
MGRALINRLGEERYQALRIEDPALKAMLRAEDEAARGTMESHPNAES